MSKITKALEKAARERLRRQQLEAEVAAQQPVTEETAVVPAPAAVSAQATVAVAKTSNANDVLFAKPVAKSERSLKESLKINPDLKIDPHIIVAIDPKSPISEQYRIVRTNLQSMKPLTDAKVILVTSSVHGEGKSVSSINLALSLAQQQGMRVLLIDADLRASAMERWLGLETQEKGLSTALTDGGSLDGLLVPIAEGKLWLLPAGPIPDQPAELLDSSNMKRLIEAARKQFDMVVIDSPPVLPVADPGILGRLVDGVVLVVRSGKTQRGTLEKTKGLLKQTHAKMLGCLLTCTEFFTPSYYGYYKYGNNGKNGSNGSAKKENGAEQGELAGTVSTATSR
jgi:capsular exopolysaccharide synthesis family protein